MHKNLCPVQETTQEVLMSENNDEFAFHSNIEELVKGTNATNLRKSLKPLINETQRSTKEQKNTKLSSSTLKRFYSNTPIHEQQNDMEQSLIVNKILTKIIQILIESPIYLKFTKNICDPHGI